MAQSQDAYIPPHVQQLASLGRALGHEFEPEAFEYDVTFFTTSGTALYKPLPELLSHVIKPEVAVLPDDLTSPPFDHLLEVDEVPEVEPYPASSSLERLLMTFDEFVKDRYGNLFGAPIKKVRNYGRLVVFTANEFVSNPWDIPERDAS